MSRGVPFEKGKSGNPGGRPKGASEVRELAREYTAEAVKALVHWAKKRTLKAASASVAAANSLLDRGYGKPNQEINVTRTSEFDGLTADERDAVREAIQRTLAERAGRIESEGRAGSAGSVPAIH